MNRLLLLAALFPMISSAEIYKTTDEDGRTVYTDIAPQKDATEVDLPELNVVTTPKSTRTTASQTAKQTRKENTPQVHYSSVEILQPTDQQTLRSNEGTVVISVHLTPRLFAEKGDRLVIKLDGQVVGDGATNTVKLENVDRGTHQLSAAVINHEGRAVATAKNVEFHLKRFSRSN
ncbi:MAG TPA: hypothetical protein DD979_02745 [Gammaproteobacteria bacterium]|jgi:hypothetical protein|nr:hypothetical protein [Gammaproteobacteria bacterium]